MECFHLSSLLDVAIGFIFVELGVSKVDNGDSDVSLAVVTKHHIFWFQIIESEPSIVNLMEELEELDHDFENLCGIDIWVLSQVVLEGD